MMYKYIVYGIMSILITTSAFFIGAWIKKEMSYESLCKDAGGLYIGRELCINPSAVVEI